ncbi:MAG: glycosyltransferase family 4 protein [Chloroflexi bacterium]|nr:glycosyltransferase family 4 protein [Chloroflexota bacterium]
MQCAQSLVHCDSVEPALGRTAVRVAINVRNANLAIPDGTGESMRGLVGGLARTNPGHDLDLLADAAPRFAIPVDTRIRFRAMSPFVGGNRGLRSAFGGDPWYRVRVAADGCWRRWDGYVQSAHEPPPAFGIKARVAIVHDLAFTHRDASSNFGAAVRSELDRWTALNVHLARAIVAVSESVAFDVVRTYGVPRDRVIVAHHGFDRERFHCNHADPQITACRWRHGIEQSYLLFVGTIQPRKNIPALVEAVARARAAGMSVVLVVAGADGWESEKSLEAMARAGPQAVRHLGRVPADDLPLLMAGAQAFVSVARAEGFGMPALEAMASGIPVVVTNEGGLAEVVGDAGLHVDPGSPDEISQALMRVIEDTALRESLITRGLGRAAGFTWDTAARSVWGAIEQACASC